MIEVNNVFAAYDKAVIMFQGVEPNEENYLKACEYELKQTRKAYKQLMKRAANTVDGGPLKRAIGNKFVLSFPYVDLQDWVPGCDNSLHLFRIYAMLGPGLYDELHIDKWHQGITLVFDGHVFHVSAEQALNFFIINGFNHSLDPRDCGKGWHELYDARVAALSVVSV